MHTRQRLQKRLRRVSGILENARKILCGPLPGTNPCEDPNAQLDKQTDNNVEQSEAPTHAGPAEHRASSPVMDNEFQSAPHDLALSEGHEED